ncbi:glycogenin-1-like [Engraulis encrasicolus]|uniref:glycogenin-1-like n=1 Tax=Engraulis encrasicolus TaxID=184585 RepID=UPI002FD6DBFB
MAAGPVEDQAFVTLATTDAYCMGALVVGKSLRRHGTRRRTVVMVSPNVSQEARRPLERVFDEVVQVDVLDSGDRAHLAWLGRPDLGVTFTKLHCWTLIRYRKAVFLDADTLVLCNVDDLFEREEFSASPDPGWPDCFNSGVFVFRPSLHTHSSLLQHAAQHGSFDGGDQGLLNSFFGDWARTDISRHLPFTYNLSANAFYSYLPAFNRFGHDAKIVHFLGGAKPWHYSYNPQAYQDSGSPLDQYVKLWWAEYHREAPPTEQKLQVTTRKHVLHSPFSLLIPLLSSAPHCSPLLSSPLHFALLISSSPPHSSILLFDYYLLFSCTLSLLSSPPLLSSPFLCSFAPLLFSSSAPQSLLFQSSPPPAPPPPPGLASASLLPAEVCFPPPQLLASLPPEVRSPLPRRPPPAPTDLTLHVLPPPSAPRTPVAMRTNPEDTRSDWTEQQDPPPGEGGGASGSDSSNQAHDTSHEHQQVESEEERAHRRRMWEEGHVDYLGKDAFQNIRKKLDRFLH